MSAAMYAKVKELTARVEALEKRPPCVCAGESKAEPLDRKTLTLPQRVKP